MESCDQCYPDKWIVCVQDWRDARVHQDWIDYMAQWRNLERCKQEVEERIRQAQKSN